MELTLFIFLGIISASVTFALQHKFKVNVVLASAIPSFILGLFFHFLNVPNENEILAIVFTASFVGMSATNFHYYEIALGGAVSTFLILKIHESFHGFGGAMGTSAFLAVILSFGLRKLYRLVVKKAE